VRAIETRIAGESQSEESVSVGTAEEFQHLAADLEALWKNPDVDPETPSQNAGARENWRWMETGLMSDVQLLDQTFPGGRRTPSGKHHKWHKLFSG
jgi:hypothetical protein